MTKFRTEIRTDSMELCLVQGSLSTARYARFGPFHIDQQRQQIFRNGTLLRMHGKVYEALIVLLQKQGELVTRAELKRALWPADSLVNHNANLNTTVNKLRRALSESTNKLAYIETIPRKGYIFAEAVAFSDVPFPAIEPANAVTSELSNATMSKKHGSVRFSARANT